MAAFEALSLADRELLQAAERYRTHAHAPISNYHVGAAVRDAEGRLFGGCNVEHIVLSLSCCAERVAVHSALAEGARRFVAVAVFTESSPPAAPCGSCRQVLHTWGVSHVVLGNPAGETVVCSLDELLPRAFSLAGPLR